MGADKTCLYNLKQFKKLLLKRWRGWIFYFETALKKSRKILFLFLNLLHTLFYVVQDKPSIVKITKDRVFIKIFHEQKISSMFLTEE